MGGDQQILTAISLPDLDQLVALLQDNDPQAVAAQTAQGGSVQPKGRVFRKKGYEIPEAGRTARGTNIVNVLQVEQPMELRPVVRTSSSGKQAAMPSWVAMRRFCFPSVSRTSISSLRHQKLRPHR